MRLKKGDYILIIICVIVVLITFIIINLNKDNNVIEDYKSNNMILLSDYSRFFTLESCMYKYVNYLQMKDNSNLMKLLDKEYIDNNNINENNVLEFLGYLDGTNTFKLKEVYYDRTDKDIIKYYVYGEVIKEVIDSYQSSGIEKYYVIKLDTINMVYSIAPYESNLYEEVKNG